MSDHVANLVGRMMGTAPVVRPRIPSRYESSTFDAGEPSEIVAEHDYPSKAPREVPPRPIAATPSAAKQAPAALAEQPAPAANASEEQPIAAVLRPLVESAQPAARDLTASRSASLASVPPPPAEQRVDDGTPAGRLVLVPMPQRQHQPPPATPAGSTAALSGPAARPIVRVHIGSIEVRSAPQAGPVPARPPAGGARPMSLDEYLSGRNRGSRNGSAR